MTDPTQRKTQVRVTLAVIMFTAGTALACGTTKPAAEGTPPAATAQPPSQAGAVSRGARRGPAYFSL
jgi:hypothetical protein